MILREGTNQRQEEERCRSCTGMVDHHGASRTDCWSMHFFLLPVRCCLFLLRGVDDGGRDEKEIKVTLWPMATVIRSTMSIYPKIIVKLF